MTRIKYQSQLELKANKFESDFNTFVNRSSLTISGERGSATAADICSTSSIIDEEQDELNWKQANDLALRAACELQMSNGDLAAGSLYKLEWEGQLRHLFVSANRRLPINSPNDLSNAQLLVFDDKSEIKRRSIALSREKVCHVWNTRLHWQNDGKTVVELSDDTANECRRTGANFLKIDEARAGEEVCVVLNQFFQICRTPSLLRQTRECIKTNKILLLNMTLQYLMDLTFIEY